MHEGSWFARMGMQQPLVHIPARDARLRPCSSPASPTPHPQVHEGVSVPPNGSPLLVSSGSTGNTWTDTTLSPLTPLLLLTFLLKSRRWHEGALPDQTTPQEVPVALGVWGRGREAPPPLPRPPREKQGSYSLSKAWPPSHRPVWIANHLT